MVSIRPITVDDFEIAPNWPELLAEYARESAINGMPTPDPQLAVYRALEATGKMHVIGAYSADLLIGFIVLIVTVNPHYGVPLAVTESYFVAERYRGTGAGLKLLRAAEDLAKDLRAVGLLVSSPKGGRLGEVLTAIGYAETNRVFFRGLE